MYSAPSVHYPAGRSPFAVRLLISAWLAGASSTAAWALVTGHSGWRQAAALACVLGCGILGWRAITGVQRGTLSWLDQNWHWSGRIAGAKPEGEGAVVARLDLQHVMLLQFSSGGKPLRWLWLERSQAPHRWDDLRRAVYSRARVARSAEPDAH